MTERRRVLKVLTGMGGAAIVGTGVVTTGALMAQGERRPGGGATEAWKRVARLDALEQGRPLKVAVIGNVEDAWIRTEEQRIGNVWLLRDGPRAVRAFSTVCPHLGCSIDADDHGFICKCHDSHFTSAGARVDGPSPRGMDPIEARVEGEYVEVRYKRFRLGTSTRTEA
ncbi:MAG: Rieske 2Fe-2S domain-containing protein [Deltaproteobacteria bacterium]|nr:Rieske 2Fe-2S domain-containing protein [Deltaproteobacteria bacterium]